MKMVNRSFKLVFTFVLKDLTKKSIFSIKLFMLLPDKLFYQGDLKWYFTLYEMLTGKCHCT